MTKDRIKIDGVWYVKETAPKKITLDPTHFVGCVAENSDFCFQAKKLLHDDRSMYPGVDIEFTDKRGNREDWKTEYWDSDAWFRGIYNENPESMETAYETLDEDGVEFFRAFIGYLIEIKWL